MKMSWSDEKLFLMVRGLARWHFSTHAVSAGIACTALQALNLLPLVQYVLHSNSLKPCCQQIYIVRATKCDLCPIFAFMHDIKIYYRPNHLSCAGDEAIFGVGLRRGCGKH